MNKLTAMLVVALLGVSLVACGGTTTPGGGGNPADAPVISSFKAEPAMVPLGGESTLTWNVSGETSLKITPNVGAVMGSSRAVSPTGTTEYTLTASNDAGNSVAKTTVTVKPPPTQTIGELVQANPELGFLARILAKTGLDATLASDGPYTLFAPTDAAIAYLVDTVLQISFEEFLNKPDLADIFKYHIVPGKKLASELQDGDELTTLQGYPLTIEVTAKGEIRVEAATITEPNLVATNGVIHIISDEVLIPPARGVSEYSLNAAAGASVSGMATFQEVSPTRSEVVLNVTGAAPGTTLTAHIHKGNVPADFTTDSGEGAYTLEPVTVGGNGKGTSTSTFEDVAYVDFLTYDGYLAVHSATGDVVAYAPIGLNGPEPESLWTRAAH